MSLEIQILSKFFGGCFYPVHGHMHGGMKCAHVPSGSKGRDVPTSHWVTKASSRECFPLVPFPDMSCHCDCVVDISTQSTLHWKPSNKIERPFPLVWDQIQWTPGCVPLVKESFLMKFYTHKIKGAMDSDMCLM